ncbi:YggS family pyridoxal phosphate-dependent enzyme [Chthonobacter albigriseus]|uniref:YggS family pyridoxal phosphate-dependent enzyme n=1 Tax=Chthonobacter albigriseus TaxID=1683161 RepID=UPI0015EF8FC5|nr:YggS family pyridoxal phosphate-dependent enzyme [Chthonobacter albigriseus]
MTATAADRLRAIRDRLEAATRDAGRPAGSATLIAVSKTFEADDIRPVIAAGQRVFGENRVQEAMGKWPALRAETDGLELHLIGPLQSNKAREAVAFFDVIHTVDRDKIAAALAAEIARQGRAPKLLVQVNTGEEPQKAGIAPAEAVAFVERCRTVHGLAVAGLMCIPPVEENPSPHFALLDELADRAGVPLRSMGMSADFETAIRHGATHVRVGSAIFGHRDTPA